MKIGSSEWKNLVQMGSNSLGVGVERTQVDQITIHALELIRWNRKVNLTAITDPVEVAVKHYIDSAVPAGLIKPGLSIIDIGSGGGFPGIVLKILIPSSHVTLVESSRKKVNFLKHVIRTIGLEDIEALHVRAEELSDNSRYLNKFDVATCRAFTQLDKFIKVAKPFILENGIMIALKGRSFKKETILLERNNIKHNGKTDRNIEGFNFDLTEYSLPHLGSKRALIIIKQSSHLKTHPTNS